MPLQKIEWLRQEEVSSLSGVSSLLGVFEGAPVRVPASLLSASGGVVDPRVSMWLGSGASSESPHMVFDSPLSAAGFLLLRYPLLPWNRLTVYGLRSADVSDCYYWDSSNGQGWDLTSDRLSSDRLGVFGRWDAVGSVYVCFNLGAS